MLIKSTVVVLMFSFILFNSNITTADDDHEQNEALRLRLEGKILPLETILNKVNQVHSGKILEAELENEHDRYIYEIEFLNADGSVLEFKYDAKTAILLSIEKED